MDLQLLKTTACLTGLGLCTTMLGCQSVGKQDYYQPHSHHGETVHQVPQAYPSYSSPTVTQPAPTAPTYTPNAPMYTPKRQQPTLIAPPGQNAPMNVPMAPPAVPGVAPYGDPNGGLRPVPAPTSWIPAPNGGYMPAGYVNDPYATAPWVPQQQQPAYMGPLGLITPADNSYRVQPAFPTQGQQANPLWTSPNAQVQFLPVNHNTLNHNSPVVTQNSGQTLFAPGWQERQTVTLGNNSQMSNPWQEQQHANNPVSLNTILIPQKPMTLAEQTRFPYGPGEQIMISPPSTLLVEDWPVKVAEAELVKGEGGSN
ncbi:MAG: hypothetical protein R3C11_13790 [Planctomycetaceae bacterium]